MDPIISFIELYGYPVVFAGAVFEGESVVLLGGLSSHETYLLFPLVVLFAAAGAIVADWSFFFLGRYKKESLLVRFPWLKRFLRVPTAFIEKNPKFISFTMRFMYGFRSIVPFSIGLSRIPVSQFLIWNGLGAFLWAIIFAGAGYIMGGLLETALGGIRKYEFRVIVFVVLAVVAFNFMVHGARILLRKRKKIETARGDVPSRDLIQREFPAHQGRGRRAE